MASISPELLFCIVPIWINRCFKTESLILGAGDPKGGLYDTLGWSLPSIIAPQGTYSSQMLHKGHILHRWQGEGVSSWELAPGPLLLPTCPGAAPGPHLSWPLSRSPGHWHQRHASLPALDMSDTCAPLGAGSADIIWRVSKGHSSSLSQKCLPSTGCSGLKAPNVY